MEYVRLSKLLSFILRHGASKENIVMTADGFVRFADLLVHPRFKNYSTEDIKKCAQLDNKQRYIIVQNGDEWSIRANQGHSLNMTRISDASMYPTVVHGTYTKHLKSIRTYILFDAITRVVNGLSRMDRLHIHFTTRIPTNSDAAGIRKTCNVLIHLDIEGAMKEGIEFYESENGVVLSPGLNGSIEPRFFFIVTDRDLVIIDIDNA